MEEFTGTVGVFDSGIGGLTVLKECAALLPRSRFYYLGDNDNAPYGSKPKEEIRLLVRAALNRFSALRVDAAVLACNTATAVCADELRKEFSFPVVGMEPAVRPAAQNCKRALVLCTPQTAASERLHELAGRFPQCEFAVHGCPDLARAVERCGGAYEKINLNEHLPAGNFDGVVLGCTHYIFLKERICAHYGVPVYDGNAGTARRLSAVLAEKKGGATTLSGFYGFADHCEENANLCSEICRKTGENGVKTGVFFLGSAKNYNKIRYKQMFANENEGNCHKNP